MLMTIFKIYLATVAIALVTQAMTTARAQMIGIQMNGKELVGTIGCAIIPIANLIIAYDCITMMFNRKGKFTYRYLYVHDRLDEITIKKDKRGIKMEMEINFDKEKLFNWLHEDCKIDCKNCPLEGYMCDTLLEKVYTECVKEMFRGE